MFHIKFDFFWPSGSCDACNIHVYCPGVCVGGGKMTPWGPFFLRIINIQSSCRFFKYFHYKPMTDNDGLGWGLYGPQGHDWRDLQKGHI